MYRALTLVFGLPRSGTTWLGKLFDSHPDTLYVHEPDSWKRLDQIPRKATSADGGQYQAVLSQYVNDFVDIKTSQVTGKLPVFPKHYYARWHYVLRRLNVMASKAGSRVGRELPAPYWVRPAHRPQLHAVWKSIEAVSRMGLVLQALPEARGILILRHPCGQIASVTRGDRGVKGFSRVAASEDYGILASMLAFPQAQFYGLTIDKFKAMHPVERSAWRWVLANEKALDDVADSGRCMVVRYEDVTAAPIQMTKEMFAFAGLAWGEQSEAFARQSVSTSKDDYYSVYKDPEQAAKRWQHDLSPAEVDLILDVIKDTRPGRLFVSDKTSVLDGFEV